jgi:hypothetical protein
MSVSSTKTVRKTVAVSPENYERITRFGHAGESMNDALTRALKSAKLGERKGASS